MIKGILNILFNILGIVLASINSTGFIAKVLAVVSLCLFIIGLIKSMISIITGICKKDVVSIIFGLFGLVLSLYGLIAYRRIFQIIKSIF